ncbi:hypothetical protein GCM10010466_63290 [Planomonospora alba]|uniref:Winged helix-turn-helix domain-containing protein n=1 Tax=Planomonospora alba TaxID=161354 RepID=A0ABP6P2N7_9ACTN
MATPSGWRRDGNLPNELTNFIGRTRLLAGLKQRLQEPETRLVTLTGIGGVGKSRTALRVAHLVRGQFADGVWFADLARLQDAGMVRHTITSALGIADQSARSADETLSEWVGDREILLIIDTCEHLVDACARLFEDLLRTSPRLRILATSRQSLNAQGEHTVAVPPLSVPGDVPGENPFTNESVQLFAARAGAVVPSFQLDERNIEPVSELCRRLDGIPLAIELAAVRLRALSVEQILALLTDRFSLLAGASRTALPRHQTLRAAIGWSHELCEPAERLLWARLSVFAGDFELEAARYVCAGDSLPGEDVTDLISSLVEKSILLSVATPSGHRYRLIDTLRDYGEEWLDKLGETEAVRRRHRDYYLQLARRGEEAWSGPRQVYWYVRMRHEHDNIRVALDYCLTRPEEMRLGLQLLSSLWFMWVACGLAREGRLYLEKALELVSQPSPERCKALWVLSYVLSSQGNISGAMEAAERCSSDAVRVGDSGAVILATKMLGTAAFLQGDLQKASALLGVAIEFHRSGRELNPGLLPSIVELSMVLLMQNEPAEAEVLLRDCITVCTQRGGAVAALLRHLRAGQRLPGDGQDRRGARPRPRVAAAQTALPRRARDRPERGADRAALPGGGAAPARLAADGRGPAELAGLRHAAAELAVLQRRPRPVRQGVRTPPRQAGPRGGVQPRQAAQPGGADRARPLRRGAGRAVRGVLTSAG